MMNDELKRLRAELLEIGDCLLRGDGVVRAGDRVVRRDEVPEVWMPARPEKGTDSRPETRAAASAEASGYKAADRAARQVPVKRKNRYFVALLCLFFGGFGAHKFYYGSWGWGVLYILLIWTKMTFVVAIIEAIMFFAMEQEEFDRRYNYGRPCAFKW